MRRIFSGMSVALALVLVGATSAQAHTELTKSSPADGSSVNAPLERIELFFSEPPLIDGSKIALSDAEGADIPVGETQRDGSTLFVDWPAGIAPGDVTINWRVAADDGHVEDGTLSFTYTAAATSDVVSQSPAPETSEAPEDSATPLATPVMIDDPMVIATPLAATAEDEGGNTVKWLPIGLGLGVLIGGAWAMTRKKSDKS